MNHNLSWIIFLLLACLYSCQNNTKVLSQSEKERYLIKGDSIATHTQKMLLANVAQAMQEKGASGAVEFCNERAIPLTDSASILFSSHIQRMSDKNRNPHNSINSKIDQEAWQEIKSMIKEDKQSKKETLKQEGDTIYYYKAITIGMPTCLACHGEKNKDIAIETLQKIDNKYPNDKATGYQMGDLRGLWKIQLFN